MAEEFSCKRRTHIGHQRKKSAVNLRYFPILTPKYSPYVCILVAYQLRFLCQSGGIIVSSTYLNSRLARMFLVFSLVIGVELAMGKLDGRAFE